MIAAAEASRDRTEPKKVLVCVPNWIGDVVMATPALRAIRGSFAQSRVVYLMRPYVSDVLRGCDFSDDEIFWPGAVRAGDTRATSGLLDLVRRLRAQRFDIAILLTNSFRSAAVTRLAGIRRRYGYARDGRGWLLTDRLSPPRDGRAFVPIPALDYYNRLADFAGCDGLTDRMVLAASDEENVAVERRLGALAHRRPLVVLNPGANFGVAKCWPAEKYAALSDRLVRECDATVVASLSPKEGDVARRLTAAAKEPIEVVVDLGIGPLRALIKRCDLLVTNDTGPRHFAPAFDVPVVTVFGSSDPAWTDTRYPAERIVKLSLDCQPCMKRVCPLGHHACMRDLGVEAVFHAAQTLLAERGTVRSAGTTNRA